MHAHIAHMCNKAASQHPAGHIAERIPQPEIGQMATATAAAPAASPTSTLTPTVIAPWEEEIRELEENGRIAFLAGDTATLAALWDDGLVVNSPLNIINDKGRVLDLLASGRIRHTRDDVVIERITRFGDVVVVMGRDTVDGPPNGALTDRRFTNIWQLRGGSWIMIARHAQVVAGS
ncbi:MAG: nuclear transport factor 2 family protein [Gemmatimonadaceae bacterium]